MSGHHDKSSELDRRASMRRSIRYSTTSAVADDDDDDDYDMMAMGISDGFRPTNVSQQHAENPFNDPSDYEPTPTPAPESAPAPTPPQRPSSISKPRRQQDSFSLRHDGGMGQLNNNPLLARTTSSSSSASAASVIRPESPYQGPSGPSFPYQMYPQDVRLARTASLATTSTAPISERSYNGPRGPTHPYQMYPQNTVSAAEVAEDRPSPAAIPVGFPGARDNYQRRLGPDGEEIADMIGPDGHTEQLPPYTRYPDEAYARKALAVEAAAVAAAASAPAPPQSPPPQAPTSTSAVAGATAGAVAGVAGLGATAGTRDPERGTGEDSHFNNSPISRHSVRSFQSQSSVSQHDPSAAAMGPQMEEKQQPQLTGWQKAAKRKVWGVVPCWAIALTAIVLAMLAIVLGAILGTFFGKHGGVGSSLPGSSGDSAPSITIDAVPLPTVPPGLLPLAEGEYNLPLTLTRSPSTCFNDTTQAQAWNCNIIPYSLLSLDIKFLPGEPATSQYSATINFNKSYTLGNNVFQYGMQPPEIQDVQLILVNDTFETSRGPAWAFELPYNKTVVIPESFFPTASSSSVVPIATETGVSKRSHVGLNSRVSSSDFDVSFKRKGLARPGDKPWICHWGGTILETFIYAAQNSSRNPIVTSSSASMSASTTSSADAAPATQDPYNPNAARAFPPPGFTGPSLGDNDGTETSTATVTKTSTTDPFAAPTPSSSSYWKSSYPRVVKVEERRMAGPPSRAPYCRQYELDENGGAKAVRDKNGNIVELTIAEEETSYSSTFSTKPRIRRRDIEEYLGHSLDARDVGSDMSNCGCMWWLT